MALVTSPSGFLFTSLDFLPSCSVPCLKAIIRLPPFISSLSILGVIGSLRRSVHAQTPVPSSLLLLKLDIYAHVFSSKLRLLSAFRFSFIF